MKLEVQNLSKCFGKQQLFHGFDLVVESGEMVSILGKSGSGKTTLLNMIGMIEPRDDGAILYNDQVVSSLKQKKRLLCEHIGFIFQNFGLVDNETVHQNLSLVKNLRNMKKKEREQMMEEVILKVGLSKEHLPKKIYECSGGEQQRVAIAKLLLKDCDVILADEPTASLDGENKKNVMRQLSMLHEQGRTVLIVTHDLEVARMCERMIEL